MASPQIDNLDVDKLNDADKNEIRTFLSQTQQRTYIQQQTHSLAQVCWTKCVDNISGSKLDKNEEGCLANCVNRFMDLNQLTVKHLSSMRG